METSDYKTKLDIPGVIHLIQLKRSERPSKQPSGLFPYLETYGRKSDCEENLLMNKTIKFRENYIHNRTLRYMEPNFSYRQVITSLKNQVVTKEKPKQRKIIKSLGQNELKTLREMISKTELIINRDTQPSPKTIRHRITRSQFPNGITKIRKLRMPIQSYGAVSPDILRVTNYEFPRDKQVSPKRKMESLTFYKEIHPSQDTNASDYFYFRPKYQTNAGRIPTPRLTCDAISNTDLIN